MSARISCHVLVVASLAFGGCAGPVSVPTRDESVSDDTKNQKSSPEVKSDPVADGQLEGDTTQMKFIDVKKEDVKRVYISFATFYYGSDSKYHYILHRVHDDVYRIEREDLSDQDLITLYREKIARDRSKIPAPGAPDRSREFLNWLKDTKVERIAGIDKKQDW